MPGLHASDELTRLLPGDVVLRLVQPSDAPSYCAAQHRCRDQLRPWEPVRGPEWYDPAYQADRFRGMLDRDNQVPWVLVRHDQVIGTATLSTIVPGPWRSGDLGYWIDTAETGRGLASAAVAAVCALADEKLLLHRIAASTRTDNHASQRVLAKNGFERYGLAPSYLYVAGAWRDHILFQKILNDRPPGEPAV